jgi:hypothetical protein
MQQLPAWLESSDVRLWNRVRYLVSIHRLRKTTVMRFVRSFADALKGDWGDMRKTLSVPRRLTHLDLLKRYQFRKNL